MRSLGLAARLGLASAPLMATGCDDCPDNTVYELQSTFEDQTRCALSKDDVALKDGEEAVRPLSKLVYKFDRERGITSRDQLNSVCDLIVDEQDDGEIAGAWCNEYLSDGQGNILVYSDDSVVGFTFTELLTAIDCDAFLEDGSTTNFVGRSLPMPGTVRAATPDDVYLTWNPSPTADTELFTEHLAIEGQFFTFACEAPYACPAIPHEYSTDATECKGFTSFVSKGDWAYLKDDK